MRATNREEGEDSGEAANIFMRGLSAIRYARQHAAQFSPGLVQRDTIPNVVIQFLERLFARPANSILRRQSSKFSLRSLIRRQRGLPLR